MKVIADPVKERHFRVGVMPADKENAGVEKYQHIDERSELKPVIRDGKRRKSQESGKDLKRPGEIIAWMDQ